MSEQFRSYRTLADQRGERARITRRTFGAGLGATIAASCLYLLGRDVVTRLGPSASAPLPDVPLETLDSIAFGARLRDRFVVRPESGSPVELELIQLTDLVEVGGQTPTRSMRLEGFSLVFTGPLSRQLGQDTFRFENDRIGAFPLFIVPGSANGDAQTYVATFNRLV